MLDTDRDKREVVEKRMQDALRTPPKPHEKKGDAAPKR
jgi:hypothetical protein